ncbi:MAG: hypothetical protein IJ408_03130 [Clostridia bacterium]|nr:hypothetical protein [Clostridia bacterium]
MKNLLEKIGFVALIGTVIAVLVMLFANAVAGLVIYIISFIIAVIDLILAFKKEALTPKEFLAVAIKERTGSVITIIAAAAVIFIFYYKYLTEIAYSL